MILDVNPILSILISFLIFNGFYNISSKLSYKFNRYFELDDILLSKIIIFLLIILTLGILAFNANLFLNINKTYFQIISISVILFGFYKPQYNLNFILYKNNPKLILIYLLILIYFILSLTPITDPDSLDYHVTYPFYQLEYSDDVFPNFWLTSQLSGVGEAISYFSLAIGSFHFLQILQFLSLFLIVLVILKFKDLNLKTYLDKKYNVCLIILTMPVIIFLTSTSKPQLFPILINFLVLILTFFKLKKIDKKKSIYLFSIIIFLLFNSIQIKFSFILSSSILLTLGIYLMIKKELFYKSCFIILILFTSIIFPRELYEFIYLNPNIIFNFFNPITDVHAAEFFNDSLKHGTGNNRFLPIWLFFPLKYGKIEFSQLTYCLGPFILYFLFKFDLKVNLNKKIFIIFLFYSVIAIIFAQPVGRFFLEIFLWMLFFSIFYQGLEKSFFQNIFEKALSAYSIIFLILLIYFSSNLFLGNFSKKLYLNVLNKYADGYSLYNWANSVLPENETIISTHRSSAFYKSKVIQYEYRLYNRTKKGNKYYLQNIINENPKYLLYTSTEHNDHKDHLKNCRGKLIYYKKNVGAPVGRNPFTISSEFYDGFIYKIDEENLNKCIR